MAGWEDERCNGATCFLAVSLSRHLAVSSLTHLCRLVGTNTGKELQKKDEYIKKRKETRVTHAS